MNISIVGAGYVGLVSGTCLAAKGHNVTCIDIDASKVARINSGHTPIYERGLDDLLRGVLGNTFVATTDLRAAVLDSNVTLISVGTPFNGSEIDLSYIRDAARQIGAILKEKSSYHVVAVKSTVVPGTTDGVVLPIVTTESRKRPGTDFGVGMNPEFLREGEAVDDFLNPDRIVIGGIDERTVDVLAEVYKPFAAVDVIRTTTRTAEMIKYASNSLLATLISFSNEIANLCSASGDADVREVLHGVHLDKRFSPFIGDGRGRVTPGFTTYLEAGCGFGGSCFPKDVRALISYAKSAGVQMPVLEAVMNVNEAQPRQVLKLLEKHFPSFDGVRVAVLGLAFKPGTDDTRESPALPIVRTLVGRGATVQAYDPIALDEAKRSLADVNVTFCSSTQEAVSGAHAITLITPWEEFRALPVLLSQVNPQPVLVDARRMLDKHAFTRYEGIGL